VTDEWGYYALNFLSFIIGLSKKSKVCVSFPDERRKKPDAMNASGLRAMMAWPQRHGDNPECLGISVIRSAGD
jgi:hypothetical protein